MSASPQEQAKFREQASVLALVLCYMLVRLFNSTTKYDAYSAMPYARGFIWPHVTAHNVLASHFLNELPADASVSAQSDLVPHLSQRQHIYLFPYAVDHADYILLDVTGGFHPFKDYSDYATTVKAILQRGAYGILDMQNGYILLKRGYPTSDITPAQRIIDENAPR